MLHFHVFGYRVYVFLFSEVCTNKLVPYSELMIYIGYKDNRHCFMCHKQENIIFHSTYAIFDEKLFSKYTDSYLKKCKLYNNKLDKISLEIELLVPGSSGKDESVHTPFYTYLFSTFKTILLLVLFYPLFLSYKSQFLLLIPGSKKLIVEIEEDDNVDSDIEMVAAII